ncbi:MAG: indolepyruvate/phenylpyruvate decarboxylase [Gammaproteobacteria bacterium]|nr:indolepyruvate/phenylpyruvate decarboxylase [Gammaproteobacteria bacterium]
MNVGESLLLALRARGVREIFGIPGDFALPLFKVIEDSGILPLYTLSHEPAVGFAADAAARVHAGPSVAAVTYGAGGMNMVNPIAAAYAEKSPVVVVSGGPDVGPRHPRLGLHHQAKTLRSQFEVFREVTCDQAVLEDPARAPAQIARVLDRCLRESRPVYIEVPRDRVLADCAAVAPASDTSAVDPGALEACVKEILERLRTARAPVLMVDVEVRRFRLEAQVAALAARLGIPVVTTFLGRGLLAEAQAPLQGTYTGVAGDPAVTRLVEESDCLLALGVILTDTNFALALSEQRFDLRRAILACDGEVALGFHVYPNIPLAALVAALSTRVGAGRGSNRAPQAYPRGLVADEAAVSATDIARAVNDLFAVHGPMPIAADTGDCLFTTLDIENTTLAACAYYATMGYGVPAGLGVQAATGRRPLILVGDGAFQMTGWELLNCPRYGWDPIVVVFNNASWEMLRMLQPESRFNDLPRLDFAAIADVLGGRGHRVGCRRELAQALAAAAAERGRFQLLDVSIERGVVSTGLERTFTAIREFRRRQAEA